MSLILAFVASGWAQDFGYVAIMQQAREALIAKDYRTAKTLLTAAEAAAPTSASPLAEADLANLWFYRGLMEWRAGDKDKGALDAWRKVLVVAPQFEPDPALLPETDAQDVLYALRGEVRNYAQFASGVPDDSGDALIFIDGKRLAADDMLTAGRHLVQVRCADGSFAGSWHEYGQAPADYLVICSGGSFSGGAVVKVDPKAAKAAEKAKAEAEKRAAAEKAAAEKAAAEKALVEAKAAEKAKGEAEKKAAAEKLESDKKAAAEKLESEKKAAAEKAAAEKLAAEKLAAEKKAAEKATVAAKPDEKAAAEKLAVEKAAAEKAASEKAAAEKLSAEKKAATEKAAAEKAAAEKLATKPPPEKSAAEKLAAEKAAAEKAAAEKATANVTGSGSSAKVTRKSGPDVPAIALMTLGGGLIAGGVVMNYTVVEPAYTAIADANANPGSLSSDAATAWEGRFDVGRYSTIGMIGGGAALLGVGVVLQVIDVPVAILPNGIVVSGRW